jgi:adenine-specific DNA-methyltransferase
MLTASFPWYQLSDAMRGPSGGFVYERRQNKRGEEVGGIVPHITLKSITNNERSKEEILTDRPEIDKKTVRVCGPFVVEGSIPPAQDIGKSDANDSIAQSEEMDDTNAFNARMIEILRKTPVLRLAGNKQVKLTGVRPPARALVLNAEAVAVNGEDRPFAFVFGPENGQVVERLVVQAMGEAQAKKFKHLVVIGFAIHPNARQTIEHAETLYGVPASYVQATPDLLMGDLLKNMRSSQIFSVCGLPEIEVKASEEEGCAQVELLGLDVFDPIEMKVINCLGNDVPAWFLDTDYNGMCFKVSQAFFPKTGAWDKLKKDLRITHDDTVWGHLSGTVSAPFRVLSPTQQIAVKVIDERGNELVVTKTVGLLGRKRSKA